MLTREQILEKLGATSYDKLTQDNLLNQLADTVKTRILEKVTANLDDKDLDHINALIDANQDAEVELYIRSRIDDYDNWARQIEEDTINELENNRLAIGDEIKAMQHSKAPID